MILFHTDNLIHYGLERIFGFAKKAGYIGIEVGITNNYDTQDSEYLKELEARFDIKICAFSLSEKYEERLMQSFQKTVREFPGVTINLNPPQVLSFKYKKWIKTTIPRLAKKYDLKFNKKNTPLKMILGIVPKRSDNSVESFKKKGNICLDLSALALSNEDIMKAAGSLGTKLKHIYLSNLSQNQPYSTPMNGVLPIESFLVKLAHKSYRGSFTLRINYHFLSEGNEEILLKKMIEIREFYEKYFVKEFVDM
jgi:sugar phosphate isomerase/epimerase